MTKAVHTDLDFGGGARIIGLPNGVNPQDAATMAQLNAAIENIAWKDAARVASTASITLTAPGATIDGITMVSGDRFLAKDQSTQSQNGIYIWNGAATPATRALDASTFPELEAAVLTVEEGTSAGATFRQTQINGTIDTNNVVWTSFGTSSPSATETTAGISELATQTETNTGTDDGRTVTPLKLANWSGRKLKLAQDIGDGSATSFNVDHNFNTRDVQVSVFRNSGNFDEVIVDIEHSTVNRVIIKFAVAPTSSQFRVVVLG